MSVDLHLQLRDPTNQRARAIFTLGRERPLAIEGFQKLVNRWLKTLLTPKSSSPIRRTEGTVFSSLVGGSIESLRGVEVYVIEAIEDANEQVRAQDRAEPTRPAEERLGSAALAQFVELPPAGVEIWVTLRSIAGETAQVILPYADE